MGGKQFDCVYDISAYRPEDVQLMVDIFRGHTGHYLSASQATTPFSRSFAIRSESQPRSVKTSSVC